MKTILVPTDFSEVATNAVHYAAELAVTAKANLLLFHSCHVPLKIPETIEIPGDENLLFEKESDERLRLTAESLKEMFGKNLVIDYLSASGFATEEISNISKVKKCDLIIMSTHGASGINKLLGSNTIKVIKHTQIPVLIIPDKVRFQQINKIVFACDYVEIKNKAILSVLLEFAALFNSEIVIFNNVDNHLPKTINKELEADKIEGMFAKSKHLYSFSEGTNTVDALNNFAHINNAKMIAMIRRHHNVFEQLFSRSSTRQMALYTHFPLLILNE